MENLPLLLQFSELLIPNQSCFPVILTEHFVLIGRRSNLPEYAESFLPLNQVMSGADLLPHQATSLVDSLITLAGIRHAVTGSFCTNRKVSLLMRNNKVHGIISTSHGAYQRGAEVGKKTNCQHVRASITPSPLIAVRGVMLHSWLTVYKTAAPELFRAEDSNACSLFVKDPTD